MHVCSRQTPIYSIIKYLPSSKLQLYSSGITAQVKCLPAAASSYLPAFSFSFPAAAAAAVMHVLVGVVAAVVVCLALFPRL